MKKFQYYQDELVNILIRHRFSVAANSQEEEDEFVREKGLANSTDWHHGDMDGRVDYIEAKTCFATSPIQTLIKGSGA